VSDTSGARPALARPASHARMQDSPSMACLRPHSTAVVIASSVCSFPGPSRPHRCLVRQWSELRGPSLITAVPWISRLDLQVVCSELPGLMFSSKPPIKRRLDGPSSRGASATR